jgi:hypothetical protein
MRERGAVEQLEGGEVSRIMWKLVDFPLKKNLELQNYNYAPCLKKLMEGYYNHVSKMISKTMICHNNLQQNYTSEKFK